MDETWKTHRRLLYLCRTGGEEEELVGTLNGVVENELWKEVGEASFETLSDYVEDFLGLSMEDVVDLVPSLGVSGRNAPRTSSWERLDVEGGGGGNRDRGAIMERLDRQWPDLAREVREGRMTANSAALEIGLRRPYIRVRGDDVERAVEKLIDVYGWKVVMEEVMKREEEDSDFV